MYEFLRTGRWAAATTVVIALAVLFVNLGLWQLRRHDERLLNNQVYSARLASEPVDLDQAVAATPSDVSSLEYRPTRVEGEYRRDLERLIRNMTHQGAAGFHVLTPLETASGDLVVVNRGWVPLEMDTPPVAAGTLPGVVEVEGIMRASQTRSAIGPEDPAGSMVVSRVDLDHLEQDYASPVAPVWVQASGPDGALPIPVPVPTFDETGNHLLYAIQWFGFAVIGVVGYVMLVRSTARKGVRKTRERELV